jgi:hypothetical protein
MVHSRFTHAGSGFPGRAARRAMARAATLAAITVLALGTLSGPAVAQATNKPLRAHFTKLHCGNQSNDNTWPNPDHDEPYVVIFVADLRGSTAYGRVFISQVFTDVDEGEDRYDSLQIWPLDGSSGSPIGSDDDYIMLAAMLESDNNLNPGNIYNKLQRVLPALASNYKATGMSRAVIASNLAGVMGRTIDTARKDYGDEDDRIGGIFEIVWGANGLRAAQLGHHVDSLPIFYGFDGSAMLYQLTFRLE